MKNYLPNNIYQKAGDCAVYKITNLTFNEWVKVSRYSTCDLIKDDSLCQKFNLTDFFDARFYGRNSTEFTETS